MGCCGSAHAEAKETELPPPFFGKDVKVKLVKKGWFDADFSVKDCTTEGGEENPVDWLLLDAVGGTFDPHFDFFLKYRAKGQEASTVLGCVNMQKDHDYLYFTVTYSHQRFGRHRRTHNKRQRFWTDKVVKANWVIARRCRLYATGPAEGQVEHDPEKLMGRLQIAGSGAYSRQ